MLLHGTFVIVIKKSPTLSQVETTRSCYWPFQHSLAGPSQLAFATSLKQPLSRCWYLQRPKQTLLYNLLDAIQSSKTQAAVVGISCRLVSHVEMKTVFNRTGAMLDQH